MGGADAAAIDCVTYAFLEHYRPAGVSGLRILAQTAATPAPPLATSRHTDDVLVGALGRALREVVRKPVYARVRDALFLSGIDFCGEDAYEVVLDLEREAQQFGYPELR